MPGPLHFKSSDQGKGSPRDFFLLLLSLSFLVKKKKKKGTSNSRAGASLMPFDGD